MAVATLRSPDVVTSHCMPHTETDPRSAVQLISRFSGLCCLAAQVTRIPA